MKTYTKTLLALAAGLFMWGCADETPAPNDGDEEVKTGLELARAGLQMAHDGMVRYERGDEAGLPLMGEGLRMMADGIDDMEVGFGGMATLYTAGGEPVYGIGPNSRCGTVEALIGPMEYAWSGMDNALGGLLDASQANDAVACGQFHGSHVAMAECLADATDAMVCMGETP